MTYRTPSGNQVAVKKPTIKSDPKVFLNTIGSGRTKATFRNKNLISSQGDVADSVFYIHSGQVKLTVVSERGKEAVVAVMNQGDFFGEGCLTGNKFRLSTAAAVGECEVLRLDKTAITRPRTHPRTCQPGDVGRNDRHHEVACELFHEQVSKTRLHQLQRQNRSAQVVAESRSSRAAAYSGVEVLRDHASHTGQRVRSSSRLASASHLAASSRHSSLIRPSDIVAANSRPDSSRLCICFRWLRKRRSSQLAPSPECMTGPRCPYLERCGRQEAHVRMLTKPETRVFRKGRANLCAILALLAF